MTMLMGRSAAPSAVFPPARRVKAKNQSVQGAMK